MKPNWLRNHQFMDGYGADRSVMEDATTMSALLERVNRELFKGWGSTTIVPVFNTERPRNNGVSGIILGRGGHFTCHTFSERGVLFADAYSATCQTTSIPDIVDHYFQPNYLQQCEQDLGPGFGRHVILQIPSPPRSLEEVLIDHILEAIKMTRLCRKMFYWSGLDLLQPITKSHIALHYGEHETMLNVFSCKDFSVEKLLSVLYQYNIQPIEMATVSRGIDMEDKIL